MGHVYSIVMECLNVNKHEPCQLGEPFRLQLQEWHLALPLCLQADGRGPPQGCASYGSCPDVRLTWTLDGTTSVADVSARAVTNDPPIEIWRLAFCANKILDLSSYKRQDANGAHMIVFPNQFRVKERFKQRVWDRRRNYPHKEGWDYRVAQPEGGVKVDTSTLTVFRSTGTIVGYQGNYRSSDRHKTGYVSIMDVIDERVTVGVGKLRLRVVSTSSIRLPELTPESHDADHGLCGFDIMDPNQGPNMRSQLKACVGRELVSAAEKALSQRGNVLVFMEIGQEDLDEAGQKLLGYGLRRMCWGDYIIFMSPGLPHQIQQVTLSVDGGVVIDFDQSRLVNASGVCCLLEEAPFVFGYGTVPAGYKVLSPSFHPKEAGADMCQYLHRLGETYDDVLRLPEHEIDRYVPGYNEAAVKQAISLLCQDDGGKWMFDIEFCSKTDDLGTLAFGRRNKDGVLIVMLFRKQILQELFSLVLDAVQPLLLAGRVVGFDFTQDKKVLKKEGLQIGSDAIDLKFHMESSFPVLFAHRKGGANNPYSTQLGLAAFVEMTVQCKLAKDLQVSAWNDVQVQSSEPHIDYALLDVYAILRVYEYYLQHSLRTEF